MLTPAYRRLLRWGCPAAGPCSPRSCGCPRTPTRAPGGWVEAAKDAVQERPEFMVASIAVTGADRALEAAIP
jgi:hypothetical protein